MEDLFGDGKVRIEHISDSDTDPFQYAMLAVEKAVHEEDGWDSYPLLFVVQITNAGEGHGGMLTVLSMPFGELAKQNPMYFLDTFRECINNNEDGLKTKVQDMLGDAPVGGIFLILEGHGVKTDDPMKAKAHIEAVKAMGRRIEDDPEAREARIMIGVPCFGENRFYNLSRERENDEIRTVLVDDRDKVRELMEVSRAHMVSVGLLLAFKNAQEERHGESA